MKNLAIWFALAAGAAAQTPEYLPLQVGNQWIYRTANGPQQVLSVARQETVNGNTYAVLTGLFSEAWLRSTADGVLVNYDRDSRTERPYLNFAAREGVSFPTTVHPCNTTAQVETRDFKDSFPLGDFSGVAAIRYGGLTCADAGLATDYYLPYVGLLRRTDITIAGPRTYNLTYARINGTVLISTAETTFSVSTDKAVYLRDARDTPTVFARMTLRSEDDVVLEFGSGQEIEYLLTNSAGKVVFKWSDGRSFTQALQSLRIKKEHNWAALILLRGADGQILPAGTYQLDGFVTTVGGARYRGVVTIELAEISR